MLRAVVDTNIFVSGILKTSTTCKRLINKLINKKFELIVSPKALEEFIGVMNRPKFNGIIVKETAGKLTEVLKHQSILVRPSQTLNIIKEDPSDNKFLEAALAGKADFLVSGDQHLLSLKSFRSIPIISAGLFLKRLK